MLKLGPLALGDIPRITVGFTDQTPRETVADAPRHGVDVAEVRVDQFASYEHEYAHSVLKRFSSLPTIATIRIRSEGGEWDGTEEERLELFRAVLPFVDALDIELRANGILSKLRTLIRAAGKLLIVSHHDFVATPDIYTLDQIAEDATKAGADIIKVATQVNSREDVQNLATFCISNSERNLIVIGMGGRGLVSRLLFPALNSLMTFAYIGKPTAPGQLPYEEMFHLMRTLYPDFNDEKINELSLMDGV